MAVPPPPPPDIPSILPRPSTLAGAASAFTVRSGWGTGISPWAGRAGPCTQHTGLGGSPLFLAPPYSHAPVLRPSCWGLGEAANL